MRLAMMKCWTQRLAFLTALIAGQCTIATVSTRAANAQATEPPVVKAMPAGESHLPANKCRKMIVGPSINQPDPFPGYAGFVGWECPVRLRDGTMYVTFNAGYWHGSAPTPLNGKTIGLLKQYGMRTDVEAPTGGRAMICKSTDGGVTWSRPETLLDTPCDDRHPAASQLSSGTLVCSLFTWPGREVPATVMDPSKGCRVGVIRSFDGGETWEQEPHRLPPVFTTEATDGPPLELPDGAVLLDAYGHELHPERPETELGRSVIAIFRSQDEGATWALLAKIVADHDQFEPSTARLHDGTLVVITRPEGAITWSKDQGRTWTAPATFGMRMVAPTLQVLPDGTLVCHYGCSNHGGLRAMFSTDGGHTWIGAAENRGFLIDNTYGYSRSCLMHDGSLYLAYIATGGAHPKDAANNAIWSIRLKVRDDDSGIELLPVANE